ncbi:MAG: hypothetical protein IJ276_03560 [Alphaproteobacteria bacterium]|nr:hypothetical protein [Alphaproteobacteria bacterium]
MRINHKTLFCAILATFCGILTVSANTTPFSQYGQIQNVQTYSSNPFWNPNGPYNQRMPQVVYATGPDMNAGDCQRVVSSLVANLCATMNNCIDATIADVRPTLMLQLSRLPGHNYATSCSGWIDGEFETFKKQYATAGINVNAAFPTATAPNPDAYNNGNINIQNPFETTVPEWKGDIMDRAQELEDLKAQSGYVPAHIEKMDFPTTVADISFTDRVNLAVDGYAPFKDQKAYRTLDIEDYETYLARTQGTNQTIIDDEYCKKNPNDPKCKKKDPANNGLITENIPDEFEALLPWYGILVVKAGSLDSYANQELPIISTKYMKDHRAEFFPDNSDKALGLTRACTHSNHMAHDQDVINRAAHITMQEDDSFWSGNDYYVYDGKDVYWGWATIAGEVAMALLTMGISAEAHLAASTIKIPAATVRAFQTSNRFIDAVTLTRDVKKIDTAIDAAKAVKKGDAATRAAARTALGDAGVTVKSGATYKDFQAIARALEVAKAAGTHPQWTSALWRPWRLVATGAKNIKPTIASTLGPGATWTKRFATLAVGGAAVGANYIGREIIKSFGYSSAAIQDPTTGDVEFNSFGLLSADDIEGRENVVSHGAWIAFDTVGTAEDDDALNEAARFAEEFTKDVNTINAEDPQCNVDIYVVQPAISNPKKLKGERQIYYILMTNNQKHLQVRTK